MPYIKQELRNKIDPNLTELAEVLGASLGKEEWPGSLNYVVTTLCLRYFKEHKLNYNDIAMISGVLSNISSEFYRRLAVNYENIKIGSNGDVHDFANVFNMFLEEHLKTSKG